MRELLQLLVTGLSLGSIYGLSAMGLSLMYRITGAINLAFGGIIMLVGLVLCSLVADAGFPVWSTAMVGPTFGALVMAGLFFAVIRPVLRHGHLVVMVATLAVDVMLGSFGLVVWGQDQRSFDPQVPGRTILYDTVIRHQNLLVLGLVTVLALGFFWFFRSTMLGKSLLASAQSATGAAACGISYSRMALVAVTVSGAIAGLAAALMVPLTSVGPGFDATLSITVLVAFSMGGMNSLPGALAGGVIVGMLQAGGTIWIPEWSNVLVFSALLVAMGVLRLRDADLTIKVKAGMFASARNRWSAS